MDCGQHCDYGRRSWSKHRTVAKMTTVENNMTTLKKRRVKRSRKVYTCDDCHRAIEQGSPYTYLYGFVEVGEHPFVLRFCPTCQDEYDKELAGAEMNDIFSQLTDEWVEMMSNEKNHTGFFAYATARGILPDGVDPSDPRVQQIVKMLANKIGPDTQQNHQWPGSVG